MRPKLALGIGNILMGDDGVGVRVIEALQRQTLPPDVETADGGMRGADLMDLIAHRDKVVVVDAVQTDAPPGTVVLLDPDALPASRTPALSAHDLGVIEALHMARALGCAPRVLRIVGIRIERTGFGVTLSPRVRRAVPSAVRAVLKELA